MILTGFKLPSLLTALYLVVLLAAGNLCLASQFPETAGEINFDRANVNYMLNCQGCHGPEGVESLNGDIPRMKDYLGNFLKVAGGREYLVQVPGSANAPLSDKDLAELLNWLLVTIAGHSTPENYRPYSEAEVASVRRADNTHIAARRAKLVAAFEKLRN